MSTFEFILKRRRGGTALLVAATAFAVYALGSVIPVPGLDPSAVGVGDPLSMARFSIFALGVMPLFSAMLLVEIAKAAITPFHLRGYARGESGTRGREAAILVIALLMAATQAWGVASGYEGIDGLVASPGMAFRLVVVATFVAATALLYWLAGVVSRYGVGEGFWLLFLAPSFAAATANVSALRIMLRDGSITESAPVIAAAFSVFVIAALAWAGGAKDRALGRDVAPAMADVWPPIVGTFAAGVILVLIAIVLGDDPASWSGSAVHLALIAAMTLLATSLQNLETPRGVWALALAQSFACAGGVYLTQRLGLPFAVDGVWLVIVVAVSRSLLARWA